MYHRSNKQNYTIAKGESNLSITSVITDRIRRQVLLPINHNRYDFRTQHIYLGQISPLETIPKVNKKNSILEIP